MTELDLLIGKCLVRVVFSDGDYLPFKKLLSEQIREVWGSWIVDPQLSEVDWTIIFTEKLSLEIEIQKGGARSFPSIWNHDEKKETHLGYHVGVMIFQMVLREIVVRLIRHKNGFLLHASSCMDMDDKLHVFIASSGGGKSTSTRLLVEEGFRFVGDDCLVVWKDGGLWKCESPPLIEKSWLPMKRASEKICYWLVNKNANITSSTVLEKKSEILTKILSNLWTIDGSVSKDELEILSDFVNGNKFSLLNRNLDSKMLRAEVLGEN